MRNWTLGLAVTLAALSAGSTRAQETSTYLYDAQGRLVNNATAAVAGNSNLANYTYDSANNRTAHYSYPISPRLAPNTILPGEILVAGQAVVSSDTQSRMEFRLNGSLVISCNGVDQLALFGANGDAAQLIMQTAGNLVLYSYVPTALWATGGGGYPNAYLVLQDDGNAVIYYGGAAIWSSSTFC